jgi:regulatory protein
MPDRRRDRRVDQAAEPPGPVVAMEIATRFLGARPRTRWELERRLRRAGVEQPIVDATLDRLADLGYVDDAAFARWWGEQRDRHAPRGRRLIEAELRRSGVPREVIESFREEHASPERPPEDASVPASEEERARQALAGHLRGRPLPADPKARARVGMFLVRRGFDPDTVRAALRDAGADADEVDDH